MVAAEKENVLTRLRSIEGHLRGVSRMVEEDAYCIDVIKQVIAVIKALEKANLLILDNHLKSCVTTAIRGDDPSRREEVIAELVDVFETSNRL